MIRLLISKVGFNSISALIEKYGWDAIKPKFDLIKQVGTNYTHSYNHNVILRSISNLEREHLHQNKKKKFLI